MKEYGPGIAVEALNPKSYAFVPSNWTRKIRAAGAGTIKSEQLGMVMHYPMMNGGEPHAAMLPCDETTITNLDDLPQQSKENNNVANCLVWDS